MERGTILVVDDEPNIADLVELYLRREGYRVVKAGDRRGRRRGGRATHRPRLVVLDVGLPDIDGLEVCRRLRQTSTIPVIFLTARDSEVDRVLGLELGADDYVTKPFSPAELVARVKAVLRRADGGRRPPRSCRSATSTIDVGRREVRVDDDAGRVHDEGVRAAAVPRRAARASRSSRQQILDGVWGYDWFGDARTVDVHIAQVRKKLDDAVRIDTVRGVGYRLEPSVRLTRRAISLGTRLVVAMRRSSRSSCSRSRTRRPTCSCAATLQENALDNLRVAHDRAPADRRRRSPRSPATRPARRRASAAARRPAGRPAITDLQRGARRARRRGRRDRTAPTFTLPDARSRPRDLDADRAARRRRGERPPRQHRVPRDPGPRRSGGSALVVVATDTVETDGARHARRPLLLLAGLVVLLARGRASRSGSRAA